MFFKLFKKALPILFLAVLLSNCKTAEKKSVYTIGFSQCIGSDLWRHAMLEEIKMELSLHPNVKFIYRDANGDSKTQVNQVKELINEGIDILIISPNEAQPLTKIVEQTYNKGIPVIVIDRKTSSSLYTAYVGADNYEIGRMAGEYTASILKGKGNVLEIMGLPGSSPAIERERGFNDGIKKFDNIHIINRIYGDWLADHAEKQLTQMYPSLKNVDAVFAHNDVMALGARNVFSQSTTGRKIKIIGVDALPGNGGGLQMVSSKNIDASLLYPTGGKEAVVTAFRILNKESFLRDNILQSLVIDSTNVQLMKLQWNKISTQQKDIERQQVLLTEQEEIYNSQQVVLNVIIITLVLAIVCGGLAFYSLVENRKTNIRLENKNNEILLQRNQLIEMSTKVKMATEAKFNFFTNISHEFRTPLTLILSPVEDMMLSEKINSIAGKNLNLIYKNTFRLLRLVNQVIDYRKIEYDKQQINWAPNDIVSFVRDILDNFQHHAKKHNISLQVITKEKEIIVWFDVDMLDKVFFNLFSNALKFTNDNGVVIVKFDKTSDDLLEIEVQDNGVGMEPEDQIHIFDQFYQAESAASKGSGLGLSLSKEIINLHNGTITVSSEKWKGTKFNIKLPLSADQTYPQHVKSLSTNKEELHDKAKYYTIDLEEEKMVISDDSFTINKEHSLLIIEDNADLLNYLSEKLSPHYEIFTATNGNDGITGAYERVPDLIISDVLLPGMSGKAITEKLKTDLRTSHIPIILLTAQTSVAHQIDGIRSMADAYLTKPFNYEYLLATIKNLVKNRVILKEHFTSDISVVGKLPISKSLDKKFVNDFAGFVELNLSTEGFSVDDICKEIGISRVQLYRKVKALLGCNISDYILNRRLKKAKYLLTNESYSISEITYMVGFSTPNYFSTVFKAKYNCTPSEFKRKQIA